MRRVVLTAVGLAVAASVPALAAPGENESRDSIAVRDAVRSLHVDLDRGDVVIVRGKVGSVAVVKRWTFQEPTLTAKVDGNGVLQVTGSCPGVLNGPIITVNGSPLGECSTSIVVTLPGTALNTLVDTSGNISLSSFRGTHDLGTGSGTVSVSRTTGPSLRVDSNGGNLVVRDVSTGTLKADTGSGAVTAERVAATGAVTLSTNGGRVSSNGLSAASIDASSGSGDITLAHAKVRGTAKLSTNGGAVTATDVRAKSLTSSSGSGNVSAIDTTTDTLLELDTNGGDVVLRHVSAPGVDVSSGSGDVTVVDTTTHTVKAHTNGGRVSVQRTPAKTFDVSSGSGDVLVETSKALNSLTADTNGGDVSVTVPRGAYALTMSQNGGRLVMDGITPDTRSARKLNLSTGSGDISILGR